MRKQYDDFTQMKLKDMCRNISDMTYTYVDPDTGKPTVVPASHYEGILNQVQEKYMGEITSRQFLNIMYNQLNALKKEDEKYFRQALLCIDMGINPKDLRVNEQIAISYTHDYIEDKQKTEKKNFHLLSQDIIDTFNESKDNPLIQAQAINYSNDTEEYEYEDDADYEDEDDMDYDF